MAATAVATRAPTGGVMRAPQPTGLAEVVDLILDKGLVIDAYVRVAVIGIELVTIDARIVVASIDTYLRFAEQVNRLDLRQLRHDAHLHSCASDPTEPSRRSSTPPSRSCARHAAACSASFFERPSPSPQAALSSTTVA